MSLLDDLTPGPFRPALTHDEWIAALRDKYDGTGIGVLDDGTLINLHTAGRAPGEPALPTLDCECGRTYRADHQWWFAGQRFATGVCPSCHTPVSVAV